jgi:hypothetical protein
MRANSHFLPSLFLQICVNENSLKNADGTIDGIYRRRFPFAQ